MDGKIVTVALVLLGCVFAYSSSIWQCLALAAIVLIANAPNNKAMRASFAFYAAASLPTVQIVYSFTENHVHAIASYALLVTANGVLVGIAAKQNGYRWLTIPFALIVLSIPPIGNLNPVSLAPLAGWIFPGQKTVGLLLLVILLSLMLMPGKRVMLSNAAIGVLVLISMNANATAVSEKESSVRGISLSRKLIDTPYQAMFQSAYRYQELELIENSKAQTAVLPESTLAEWSRLDGDIYANTSRNVYVGARRFIDDTVYINVVINGKTGKVVYEQRTPPPVASPTEFVAVSGRGVIRNAGINFLICFELASTPRSVGAFINNDNPVVWISNLAWFNGDYLEKRMESVLVAWARLYGNNIEKAVMRHA